jgi:hypothetical protein
MTREIFLMLQMLIIDDNVIFITKIIILEDDE